MKNIILAITLLLGAASARRPITGGEPQDTCATIQCPSGSVCILGSCELVMNDCSTVTCPSDEECVMVDVDCVPDPCNPVPECHSKPSSSIPTTTEPPSCLSVDCQTAGGCVMVKPLSCAYDIDCQKFAKCVDKDPCESKKCAIGHRCVLQEVICKQGPCNPKAQCEIDDVLGR